MIDLPAMQPCPVGKEGRHALMAVLPEDSDHDMTLWCAHCGALRRVPVSGALITGSLDGLSGESISGIVGGQQWEMR